MRSEALSVHAAEYSPFIEIIKIQMWIWHSVATTGQRWSSIFFFFLHLSVVTGLQDELKL